MDTKQLAHVGAELLVIGGISVYFHLQITQLKRENEALQTDIKNMKEALERQGMALNYLMNGRKPPQTPQVQYQTPPSKEDETEASSSYTNEELDKLLDKENDPVEEAKKELVSACEDLKEEKCAVSSDLKTEEQPPKDNGRRVVRRKIQKASQLPPHKEV
jgi:FtsZ-binding cell division protein ZapB